MQTSDDKQNNRLTAPLKFNSDEYALKEPDAPNGELLAPKPVTGGLRVCCRGKLFEGPEALPKGGKELCA